MTFRIAWDRITNQKRDCLNPCQTLILTVGAKNVALDESRDFGELYLYFSPRIKRSEEHYFYTFLSLMAEIGGYVGLFLGFSFWHLAEWSSAAIQVRIKQHEKELARRKKDIDKEEDGVKL